MCKLSKSKKYKYYLMLQKGLSINSNIFSLSMKELSLLYEYWCFIKINALLRKRYKIISSDFIEAMDILYEISGDKESIMLANMREKALMDEQSRLKGAKEEGKQEGSNEKEILIAKKMLKKGKSIEEVSELTELSIEEVKKLVGNL